MSPFVSIQERAEDEPAIGRQTKGGVQLILMYPHSDVHIYMCPGTSPACPYFLASAALAHTQPQPQPPAALM